jgi:hypothetical protein
LALTNKFGNLRKLFEFVVVEVQIITLRYIKLILSTPQNLIKIFALLCVCVCVCVWMMMMMMQITWERGKSISPLPKKAKRAKEEVAVVILIHNSIK